MQELEIQTQMNHTLNLPDVYARTGNPNANKSYIKFT
jgi:hypothetical protein